MSGATRDATPLTRREFLALLGCGAAALQAASLGGCRERGPRPRPNILVVVGDDHRADALGCAGHPWIRTPSLDRLAAGGVRFTNAFVTTSLCSPSRATILTGLPCRAHGVLGNEANDVPAAIPTFPQLLQRAGYDTSFVGKWHMRRSSRPRPGFDHWVSFNGQGQYERNTFNVDGEWVLSREYVTDALTDHAVRILRRQRAGPFLMIVAHKAVHEPCVPAPRHAALYAGAVPAREDPRVITTLDYARTLAGLDESVGAILDELRRSGRLDDTLILYLSDNGRLLRERGAADKRLAYDASIRVPLIVRPPGDFRGGATCDALGLNLDVAATALAAAGLPPPPRSPGLDLLRLAGGAAGRDAFLYEYYPDSPGTPEILAVRTAEWKLITYPRDPDWPTELYHLRYDPDERNNRAAEPAYAEVVTRLGARLAELDRAAGPRPARA